MYNMQKSHSICNEPSKVKLFPWIQKCSCLNTKIHMYIHRRCARFLSLKAISKKNFGNENPVSGSDNSSRVFDFRVFTYIYRQTLFVLYAMNFPRYLLK